MREAPCHHQANSKRGAHNIMPISSKKVLHVLRVLHVLPDISQREAPTRYPSFFPCKFPSRSPLCHHQANSKREAHNIMSISSKKVLRVLRVLHVLPDISQREAPTRYQSPFPFPLKKNQRHLAYEMALFELCGNPVRMFSEARERRADMPKHPPSSIHPQLSFRDGRTPPTLRSTDNS